MVCCMNDEGITTEMISVRNIAIWLIVTPDVTQPERKLNKTT